MKFNAYVRDIIHRIQDWFLKIAAILSWSTSKSSQLIMFFWYGALHIFLPYTSLVLSHAWLIGLVIPSIYRPSDAIWQHRSVSTLAPIMACCLTTPSDYWNQCWLIKGVLWANESNQNHVVSASTETYWQVYFWTFWNIIFLQDFQSYISL